MNPLITKCVGGVGMKGPNCSHSISWWIFNVGGA